MRKFAFLTLAGLAVLGCVAVKSQADEWNKKTIFTFSGPVEVPGQVLDKGTYVFKLLDSQSDRHIVQVFNRNESHIYGTFLAIPDYRLEPTGKTALIFEERGAGSPPAVKAWFYPGDNFGNEFVYPKRKLVAMNNVPPPRVEIARPPAPVEAPQAAAQAQPEENTIAKASPEPEPLPAPAPSPAPAPAPVPEQQASPEPAQTLPHTGSTLPLIGLIALIVLTTAGAFKSVANKLT